MEKFPKSATIARFQDCDPLGHLNNAEYMNYFINAREDHLLNYYNLDVYAKIREGVAWVVGKHEILFKRPALLMEQLVIKSRVIGFNEKHILVEMTMFDEKESHLKAIMRSTFVPIDPSTGRSSEHNQEIMALLEGVYHPVAAATMEERAAAIKAEHAANPLTSA